MRKVLVLFAVCHADDEAVWVGGLLHGLSGISGVEPAVACLSGAGPRSPEFEAAKQTAGYERGVLLDLPLRPAPEPLPPTNNLLEVALEKLDMDAREVDLLLTHSPYGDEPLHPHHRQAHRELRRWCATRSIPFGFFTSAPSPFLVHRSVLRELRRTEPLHLLQFARCRPTLRGLVLPPQAALLGRSRWFAQFLGDADAKRRMLECYASVDQEAFRRGYGMYTSAAESLYLADDRGAAVIQRVVGRLGVPSPVDLFADTASTVATARRRVGRMLGR